MQNTLLDDLFLLAMNRYGEPADKREGLLKLIELVRLHNYPQPYHHVSPRIALRDSIKAVLDVLPQLRNESRVLRVVTDRTLATYENRKKPLWNINWFEQVGGQLLEDLRDIYADAKPGDKPTYLVALDPVVRKYLTAHSLMYDAMKELA